MRIHVTYSLCVFDIIYPAFHSLSTRLFFSKQVLKNGEESATKQTPLITKPIFCRTARREPRVHRPKQEHLSLVARVQPFLDVEQRPLARNEPR